MVKLIEVLDNDFLVKYFDLKLDFSCGAYNKILLKDSELKFNLIRLIYGKCKENFNKLPYVISGFNLKPYLNLIENLYDIFGIDVYEESKLNEIFKWYCNVFDFQNYNIEFHFLNNFDKLKSMFIVSLYSNNDVILFDGLYSFEVSEYLEYIFKVLKKFDLYSSKIFIEIIKASHILN